MAFAPPTVARADWEVKRSPFDRELVARLKLKLARDPNDAYALAKLTDLYRKYRSINQLVTEYARSDDGADLTVLGHIERERGHYAEAAASYEKALTTGGGRAVLFSLGECYERLKRPADARRMYERAFVNGPNKDHARILRKIADLTLAPESGLSSADAREAARRYYDKVLADNPADDGVRRELAEMLASHGDPQGAAAEWKKLAERLGKDPGQQAEAWRRVGELDEAAADDGAALDAYRKAYERVPRGHYLKREALEKIIGVHRRKDDLRTLAGTWERDWPAASRGFVEWDLLARLYDEVGEPARAQECFRKALAADPHALEARRRLIALYEREGRDDDAIAELRRLVQAAPGEPRFRLELAERLRKTPGGEKEAEALCARIGAETREPSVHASLAELYTRWGLSGPALAEREKLVKLEPDDDTHLVNLGELYFQRGKREKALETWRRLLTRGGKREQAMARLAEVYAEHNLNGESLELYQKALKLAPGDASLKRGLAGALERMHRDGEAEQVWEDLFDAAVQNNKRAEMLETRQRLLAVLARTGRLAVMVRTYRNLFEKASDDGSAAGWGLLTADACLKLGRLDEAERVLKQLAEHVADNSIKADAWIGLAQVARVRHATQQQIAALKRAAELEPSRARELYAQIAALSLELYRDNDALAYAQKAIALGPADAQAQLRLAEVLEKRDQIDQAVAAYQRALELDDRQWKARFTLARLHLRRGEHAAAARLYREVLRRAPDEELVVDAARRAIDLEEYLGTLGELERELQPLAYAHPEKRVYRNLLIELYQRHAGPLILAERRGDDGARKELERLGEHALGPLLEVLVDGEVQQQRQAVALLGQLMNPGAAAPLLRLAQPLRTVVDARDPRAHAGKAPRPRELRDPFDVRPSDPPGARRVVIDERPIDLRVDAAIAGARLAGPKDVAALVKLAGDSEKHIKLAAIYGLARVRDAQAEAPLLRALQPEQSGEAQAAACVGLARLHAARALPEMIKIVRDGARPDVARTGCAFALGVALDGDTSAAAARDGSAARAALVDVLGEGSDELERRAAWSLGVIGAQRNGSAKPSAALVSAVFVKREEVRAAALVALERPAGARVAIAWSEPERGTDGLDISGWLRSLVEKPAAAPSPSNETPAIAWRGLESDVAQAIGDALARHRDLQLRALADLDGRADSITAGPLTPASPSPADRAALADLGARLAPALERLAAGGDPLVRARALHVLAKIPGGGARVLAALADGNPAVRRAALSALGAARAGSPGGDGARDIDQALERALAAGDWRERRAAAIAAAESGAAPSGARVRSALAAALDDASGFVREAAARALGSAGKDGVAPLSKHVADEAPEVRAAVAAALGSTGAAQARAPLTRLAADADPQVRSAAQLALAHLPPAGN